MSSKAASRTIFKSLFWLDMGLNPGLPDRWRTLYSIDQWYNIYWYNLIINDNSLPPSLSLSLSLYIYIYIYIYIYTSSVFVFDFVYLFVYLASILNWVPKTSTSFNFQYVSEQPTFNLTKFAVLRSVLPVLLYSADVL